MSTLVTNQTATRQTVPIRAIMAAGLVGALACAAYVSGVIFVPNLGHRAAAHHPLVLIPDLITTFAFVSLAVTLPGLASVTRLPRWACTPAPQAARSSPASRGCSPPTCHT
jgi:hypothetical protein